MTIQSNNVNRHSTYHSPRQTERQSHSLPHSQSPSPQSPSRRSLPHSPRFPPRPTLLSPPNYTSGETGPNRVKNARLARYSIVAEKKKAENLKSIADRAPKKGRRVGGASGGQSHSLPHSQSPSRLPHSPRFPPRLTLLSPPNYTGGETGPNRVKYARLLRDRIVAEQNKAENLKNIADRAPKKGRLAGSPSRQLSFAAPTRGLGLD
jgi:hypothetical protein